MPDNWTRELAGGMHSLVWPISWQPRQPIISILAFTLMPNHFHLFLKETTEGGIAKFMHRLSVSYAKFINQKYNETGRFFDGTYKSRIIDNEEDFKNLAVYIMVKNSFELYPDGLTRACREFELAYTHALHYPFTSLRDYEGLEKVSPILDQELLGELFSKPHSFKKFARECMRKRLDDFTGEYHI